MQRAFKIFIRVPQVTEMTRKCVTRSFKNVSYTTAPPYGIGMFARRQMNRTFSAQNSENLEINLHPQTCYYRTLNISTNATFPQIKSAYLKLAKVLHPDVSKDPKAKEKFPLLSEAYKILTNPKYRKMYDEAIGISDPTWSEDVKFKAEFENNDEFMNYVKGNRNYDDERLNIDYSFEEKNAEDLYDYFRAKHLGGYGMKQREDSESEHFGGRKFTGSDTPLKGMNGLDMQGEGIVDPGDKLAFNMKIDREMRTEKKRRVKDNDYILFAQNRHDAYYATRQEHHDNQNIGTNLLSESKYFIVFLALGIGFIYTQIQPSNTGKLTGKNDMVKRRQKNITKGLGVKDKLIPLS